MFACTNSAGIAHRQAAKIRQGAMHRLSHHSLADIAGRQEHLQGRSGGCETGRPYPSGGCCITRQNGYIVRLR